MVETWTEEGMHTRIPETKTNLAEVTQRLEKASQCQTDCASSRLALEGRLWRDSMGRKRQDLAEVVQFGLDEAPHDVVDGSLHMQKVDVD